MSQEEEKQKLFDAQFNLALARASKDEAIIAIARKRLEDARKAYKIEKGNGKRR